MSIEEFAEVIVMGVKAKLGSGYAVGTHRFPGINSVAFTGLLIGAGTQACLPVINLDGYYHKMYQNGIPINMVLEDILQTYRTKPELPLFNEELLEDFAKMKPCVMFKIISRERNQKLLGDMPYMECMNLAAVFFLFLSRNEHGQMVVPIHNFHMNLWGTNKDELWEAALVNTQREYPYQIQSLDEIVGNLAKSVMGDEYEEELVSELFGLREERKYPLYRLSNQLATNGAGAFLYPGVLHAFAESQGYDLAILPSSIHEVLLCPMKNDCDLEELRQLVTGVNEFEVEEDEVLAECIYTYCRKDDTIRLMQEGVESRWVCHSIPAAT